MNRSTIATTTSMAGLRRRFLNLIVSERTDPDLTRRVTSLRSIDLGRHDHELFYPPGTLPPPQPPPSYMEELTLPTPTMSFRASRHVCLPFADRKVLCTGKRQHAFLFDGATQHVVTIPTRREFKGMSIAVFLPSGDDDDDDPDGTLFVMPSWPDHEKRRPEPESEQFEALVYRRTRTSSPAKSWHSELFPPLPYLRDPKYWRFNVGITSYAVVGGGSHICVSLEESALSSSDERSEIRKEIAGTYCLDTASRTWSKAGDWTLPFVGKVEYAPELKLWFGISGDGQLAAANLSAMDSEPQLGVGLSAKDSKRAWGEEDGPENGQTLLLIEQSADPKLAYLGSGRFCIARNFWPHFFYPGRVDSSERFAVLTGVEVTPPQVHGGSRDDGGEANKLQMITHKSRLLLPFRTAIDAVF